MCVVVGRSVVGMAQKNIVEIWWKKIGAEEKNDWYDVQFERMAFRCYSSDDQVELSKYKFRWNQTNWKPIFAGQMC